MLHSYLCDLSGFHARESDLADEELARLYRRLAPVIYSRCLSLLGDEQEARDASHDIFLLVWRKLHTFRGDSDVLTWVYRIATNHCLNRLRTRKLDAKV